MVIANALIASMFTITAYAKSLDFSATRTSALVKSNTRDRTQNTWLITNTNMNNSQYFQTGHVVDFRIRYTIKSPLDSGMLTRFRKRITPKMLTEVNDIISGTPTEKNKADDDDNSDNHESGVSTEENEEILILDATCAPQNIRFLKDPSLLDEARRNAESIIFLKDPSLLDEARRNAESIINTLHEKGLTDGKKSREHIGKKPKKIYDSFQFLDEQ